MKVTVKRIMLQVASCIIAIAICLGAWAAGLVLSDGKDYIWVYIAVGASIALLVAAVLVNIIGSRTLMHKYSSMKMRELYDWSEKIKSEIELSYANAEKRVRNIIALSYLYLFFLIALLLLLSFTVGWTTAKGDDGISGATSILIPIVFLCWGLVNVLFAPTESSVPSSETELDKRDYPMMFGAVERAADAGGFKKGFKIFACNDDISVNIAGAKAILHVGYMEFGVLTEEEFFNVMLHEFAHVLNRDTSRGAKFSREEQRWGEDDNSNVIVQFSRLFFLPLISALVCFKTSLYTTIASRYHEICADEAIKKYGDPQTFINGLAKSGMLSKFEELHCRELYYDFYAPEKPTGDYAKQEYELFFKYRDKYADIWTKQLIRELPARISSHPTFKMRCEAMECADFDAFAVESNPDYVTEQKKYLDLNDGFMNREGFPVYGELREKNYLSVKKILDGYYEAEKSGQSLRDDELYAAMEALFQVDNDEALKVSEKILNINPKLAEANMIKGYILMQRLDDGCIACFKEASQDASYTENAMTLLGQYALVSGNEELLKEYRSSVPEAMQESLEKQNAQSIDRHTKFEKCDLDKQVIDGMIDGILRASSEKIEKIYAAKYTDKQNGAHYAVFPVFVKGCKDDAYTQNMDKIYNFLTIYTDNDLELYGNDRTKITKLIKNADGSLIYGN